MNATPEETEAMSITTFQATDTEPTAIQTPVPATEQIRQRAEQLPTDGAREHEDGGALLKYQAIALLLANGLHDQALKEENPAAALDDIADELAGIMPAVFKALGTDEQLAEVMLPAVKDRIWAHIVVAHARAEAGDDYGYAFDVMADALRRGADPKAVRADVPRVAGRLRIETAVSAAVDAITAAVDMGLAGLATNPHDVAERLHMAIEDAHVEHLIKVGDMSLERAQTSEAFGTAGSAMARAMAGSPDPEGTAQALRTSLRMVIDEARAERQAAPATTA